MSKKEAHTDTPLKNVPTMGVAQKGGQKPDSECHTPPGHLWAQPHGKVRAGLVEEAGTSLPYPVLRDPALLHSISANVLAKPSTWNISSKGPLCHNTRDSGQIQVVTPNFKNSLSYKISSFYLLLLIILPFAYSKVSNF